jgi:NADH dehydrogenase FAD-containing subunit
MRSLQFENVYAAGDAVSFDGPKSGRRAMLQGKVAAENIVASIRGRQNSTKFEERELNCIIEMGGNKAAYIRSNAYWGGTSERMWIGRIPYWMKIWLEKRFLFKRGDI